MEGFAQQWLAPALLLSLHSKFRGDFLHFSGSITALHLCKQHTDSTEAELENVARTTHVPFSYKTIFNVPKHP